ncbi:glycosyltransferase [Paludisphaera borealis]|uniref:GT4 family glycosyltransferase n=1 Tax=Paludisphaera borealis TaxID=1387353 RepID=A0A1U7CL48_9BACT|nr:glycosyltransferase [Paludisphaera borealis]APW59651.1 GT4 family glycosyltransferase [Paludisphaera borealis]
MTTRTHRLSLAVADVSWYTTENLFRELDDPDVSLLAMRCMDYVNGWRKGVFPWSPSCRQRREGPRLWTRDLTLPPGWMKRYPSLGMRPIARAVRQFWRLDGGSRRGLVMTYPHYLHLANQLAPEVSLYYNLDDYTLYWPGRADEIRDLERRLVAKSNATVCVSRLRAEELRAAVPEASERIHHIPHGTPRPFLADQPLDRPADPPADISHLPRPLLGYVGTLEDRLDWELLDRLSVEFPNASIVIVGRTPDASQTSWYEKCSRLLARPNVHAIGWRPQAELPRYYQAFDLILIPYLIDHPFNRSCSPTKIMDGMGSSRPIVATSIPECQLYDELFDVAATREAFVGAVDATLRQGSDDGRAAARHAWARAHSCAAVAAGVLATLNLDAAERRSS